MKRPGPKPQPTSLRLLRGNPGKRPIQKSKVEPTPGAPRPKWLSTRARIEWDRLVPELERLGVLAQVDMAVFAAYCEAVSNLEWATATLARQGMTKRAGNGTVIPHPAVAIQQSASKRVQELASEFGFTPAERGRVKFPGKGDEGQDQHQRFFGPRPAPTSPEGPPQTT